MWHSPASTIYDRRLTSVLVLLQHYPILLRLYRCLIQDHNTRCATLVVRFSTLVGLTGHVTTVMVRTNATASSSERGENVQNAVSMAGLLSLLLSGLEFSMKQYQMQDAFKWQIADWKPTVRRSDAYVAPRHFNPKRISSGDLVEGVLLAHHFGLVIPPSNNLHHLKDREDLNTQQGQCLSNACHNFTSDGHPTFTARAMLARPITHLTLRMYVHAFRQANV